MMPNVKGADRTRLEIVLYSLVLAPVGVLPWIMGFASVVYGVLAIIGGLGMVALALRVYRIREGATANKKRPCNCLVFQSCICSCSLL